MCLSLWAEPRGERAKKDIPAVGWGSVLFINLLYSTITGSMWKEIIQPVVAADFWDTILKKKKTPDHIDNKPVGYSDVNVVPLKTL